MYYVGLDIHKKHISICVLNERGQTVHRSEVRSIDQMLRILEGLPDRFEVCYEASCGYGHYHDLLRPLAARVLVAHPGQLRLIYHSKNKNDRKDAPAAGQVAVLGRGADGACPLARRANLARVDQLPQPGDRQTHQGQERNPIAVTQCRRHSAAAAGIVVQSRDAGASPVVAADSFPAVATGSSPRRD